MLRSKVTLNWHGEIHTFYTHSSSRAKALNNAVVKLAKELGKNNYSVRQYFGDEKDRYSIKEVR